MHRSILTTSPPVCAAHTAESGAVQELHRLSGLQPLCTSHASSRCCQPANVPAHPPTITGACTDLCTSLARAAAQL